MMKNAHNIKTTFYREKLFVLLRLRGKLKELLMHLFFDPFYNLEILVKILFSGVNVGP